MTHEPLQPLGDDRLELLVQGITDYAIYLVDLDGIVASWNTGGRRFLGYETDEIVGRSVDVLYEEDDRRNDVPVNERRTAADEGRFESEGWRIRKDGGRFWASIVIDPVRDDHGRLVGYANVTRDLTERRAAEDALRLSEERFRVLVQSVTDYAIYMLDPTGIVTSWNTGAERAKGYTADEIIGQHFSRFYGPEDRDRRLPERALTTARTTGRFEAEGWRYRKDGTRFWASVVIDAVRDPTGELVGFAKVTRDLTERRRAQVALEEAQQTLFQSQKMDAIGQLTGGVAHDFNNLLAAIMGSLDLARRRSAAGKDVARFLDNAMHAAERGATLTQRMLAFARKQTLQLVQVDVATLIAGMMELLRRTIGPGITVETSLGADLESVLADYGQLELAILNLVVNARDAMPDGGTVVLGAEMQQVADDASGLVAGTYVRLWVADSGAGMDAETLSHAMEPFFTTKGIGKGTGLGLSMVHGLADQCGGKLRLESEPGRGTTASLWLPVARAADRDPARPLDDEVRTALPSMLVLAVDDDPLVLTNTVAMLEDMGHRVLSAVSGPDALERLRRHPVELVVSDYAMPGMTGLQLAETVRVEWPSLPLLLISGYADFDRNTALAVPCLAKPFRPAELERAMGDVARQRSIESAIP